MAGQLPAGDAGSADPALQHQLRHKKPGGTGIGPRNPGGGLVPARWRDRDAGDRSGEKHFRHRGDRDREAWAAAADHPLSGTPAAGAALHPHGHGLRTGKRFSDLPLAGQREAERSGGDRRQRRSGDDALCAVDSGAESPRGKNWLAGDHQSRRGDRFAGKRADSDRSCPRGRPRAAVRADTAGRVAGFVAERGRQFFLCGPRPECPCRARFSDGPERHRGPEPADAGGPRPQHRSRGHVQYRADQRRRCPECRSGPRDRAGQCPGPHPGPGGSGDPEISGADGPGQPAGRDFGHSGRRVYFPAQGTDSGYGPAPAAD